MALIDFDDDLHDTNHNLTGLDGRRETQTAATPNGFDAEESAGSEPDEVEVDPTTRAAASKNKAQRDAFKNFVKSAEQDEEDDEINGTSRKRKQISPADRIIDKAREYQQELFDRAKEENVIAVLDTGSGKTLVSPRNMPSDG